MPGKIGLCRICGKPASNKCSLCGKIVCDEHYDPDLMTCTLHGPNTKRRTAKA